MKSCMCNSVEVAVFILRLVWSCLVLLQLLVQCCLWLFSYNYGGYASGESTQVGAQPMYSVNVQQVNMSLTRSFF